MKPFAEGWLDGRRVEVINSQLLWKQRVLPQEHLAAFQNASAELQSDVLTCWRASVLNSDRRRKRRRKKPPGFSPHTCVQQLWRPIHQCFPSSSLWGCAVLLAVVPSRDALQLWRKGWDSVEFPRHSTHTGPCDERRHSYPAQHLQRAKPAASAGMLSFPPCVKRSWV